MTVKERLSNRTYRPLHRVWPQKLRNAMWWLMGLELMGVVPALVIFGISQPDLYRTDLWRIGYENKLNSNPAMILYAYANHRPLPQIPLIWSKTLTDLNVAISVISLFFLLTKLIASIMKYWYPIVATFANISLVTLYTVSVYGQIGPDYADPRYPAKAAWYFRYGCEMAKQRNAYRSCQIAQSSLGLTFYLLAVYVVNLGFSAYAMWPNKRNDQRDEDDDEYGSDGNRSASSWEMQGPKSTVTVNAVPFTPRTQAFHTLDRQLPLRQNYR